MHPSGQNIGMDDDTWRSAFAILERSQHLGPTERREYAASATSNPAVLHLLLELLEDEDQSGGQIVSPETAAPAQGERIGRYEILGHLGGGGNGEVYSARDVELGRDVALKFLTSELARSQGGVEKLIREARAASALNHRNIVTIYEVIRSGEQTAIAMELLEGTSLRAFCGEALPARRVIHLGQQIATALAAAHGKDIIHRDIKPENVMADHDDYVKVVDFGLARRIALDASTTRTIGGTVNYLSPEQVRGERAGPPSDVFSLGVVLYEIATGAHPFQGETPIETLNAVVSLEPPPPSSIASIVPKTLSQLILEMLSKLPESRPTAGEVATRLSRMASAKTNPTHHWVTVMLVTSLLAAAAIAMFVRTRRPEVSSITFS